MWRIELFCFLGLVLWAPATDSAPTRPCQTDPSGWCPGETGDPCGRHRYAKACKADKACFGLPYRGESAIACIFDDRGFAENCPTVGCTGRKPAQ